jgi:hypothetical protein
MHDVGVSENLDTLSVLWGYELVAPSNPDARRFYRGTLPSGHPALLSFWRDSESGRGTCSFTVHDIDAAAIRRAILLWQRNNRALEDRLDGEARETFWDVIYAGYSGVLILEEIVTVDRVAVTLSKVEN